MQEALHDLLQAHSLCAVFERLTPKSEAYQKAALSPKVWLEPPYAHERRLYTAYVMTAECKQQGLDLFANDIKSLAVLFEWIHNLTSDQVIRHDFSVRTLSPPLISTQEKEIFAAQTEALTSPQFTDILNHKLLVVAMLRGHMMVLNHQHVAAIPIIR